MRYATLASLFLCAFTAQTLSQQDEKVTFHVTSVSQADATDYCTTGKYSGGWPTFDFFHSDTTTEVAAPFAVFERACPELSRRVRFRQPIARALRLLLL